MLIARIMRIELHLFKTGVPNPENITRRINKSERARGPHQKKKNENHVGYTEKKE